MNCLVRVYVTKNSLSPFVAMVGEWPQRSRLFISCKAGHHVVTRTASDHEQSILDDAIRHPAVRYSSLLSLVRDQKNKMPIGHFKSMISDMKENWPVIKEIIDISEKRKTNRQVTK